MWLQIVYYLNKGGTYTSAIQRKGKVTNTAITGEQYQVKCVPTVASSKALLSVTHSSSIREKPTAVVKSLFSFAVYSSTSTCFNFSSNSAISTSDYISSLPFTYFMDWSKYLHVAACIAHMDSQPFNLSPLAHLD